MLFFRGTPMKSPTETGLSRRDALGVAAAGAALTAAAISAASEARAESTGKATFVLVHPAWFGGWCWQRVTPLLRARGYEVYSPTLTGLGERAHLARPEVGLATHIEDIVNVLKYEDLQGVVIVGNSSGGMVIAGVADQVPERIAQLVYLDAFVPQDGQSMMDIIPPDRRPALEAFVQKEGEGWLLPRFAPPPWDKLVPELWRVTDERDLKWVLPRLRPTPFGQFREAVRFKNPAAEKILRTFVRTQWPHPGFDRYAAHARAAAGWRLRHINSSHLPFITHPRELADRLAELAS
jgi:pimeloyl-ACP methyl ester carboxylesterase